MGGGLMQLVAYGAQDVYLTGNPKITFFKIVYRRHTNFSVEPIEGTFSGTTDFGRSGCTCTVARNGDLITKVYLKTTVTLKKNGNKAAFIRRLGHFMMKNYNIQIGGTKIDQITGDWQNIWWELQDSHHDRGYDKMIGNVPEMTELNDQDVEYTMYIPLCFWFNRNNGLALPLIALQYHDVRINVEFSAAKDMVVTQGEVNSDGWSASIKDAQLLIDYVYLDSEERKRFAQSSHEYLIEQLQSSYDESIDGAAKKIALNFNHPCKFLAWTIKMGKYTSGQQYLAYHPTDVDRMKKNAAELLFLLALKIKKVESGGTVTWGIESEGDKYAFYTWNTNTEIGKYMDSIKSNVLAVTASKTGDLDLDTDNDPGNDAWKLSSHFATDPLSQVEFLDESWKNIPLSILSSNIDSLKAQMGTNYNSDVFNLLKDKYFVNVRMWDNYGVFIDGSHNPIDTSTLLLNGQERFKAREGAYFNYVQPYQHFTHTPADGINVYSFALNPQEHQPSGTCNFSRIDNANLGVTVSQANAKVLTETGETSNINVNTLNYNVLRIMGGMGGLAYSN